MNYKGHQLLRVHTSGVRSPYAPVPLSPAPPPLYCMSVLTRKLLGQLGPLGKDKPNTPPANEYRIFWVKYNKRKHISKLSAIISLQLALPRNIKTIWFYIVSNTYYRQSRKTSDWTWQIDRAGINTILTHNHQFDNIDYTLYNNQRNYIELVLLTRAV